MANFGVGDPLDSYAFDEDWLQEYQLVKVQLENHQNNYSLLERISKHWVIEQQRLYFEDLLAWEYITVLERLGGWNWELVREPWAEQIIASGEITAISGSELELHANPLRWDMEEAACEDRPRAGVYGWDNWEESWDDWEEIESYQSGHFGVSGPAGYGNPAAYGPGPGGENYAGDFVPQARHEWATPRTVGSPWDKHYGDLLDWLETQTDRRPVAPDIGVFSPSGKAIGVWLAMQRIASLRGRLTARQRELLAVLIDFD